MDLRQFTDLGGDIGKRVTDAINSGNYSQLNRDIRRQIERAFTGNIYEDTLDGKLYKGTDYGQQGQSGSGMNGQPGGQNAYGQQGSPNAGFDRYDPNQGSGARGAGQQSQNGQTGYAAQRNMAQRGVLSPIPVKFPSKAGNLIMAILGYCAAVGFGITWMLFMVAALTATAAELGGAPTIFAVAVAMIFFPFAVAGVIFGIIGTRKYLMSGRMKQYLSVLKNRTHCTIAELAAQTRQTVKYVTKDLKELIQKGYFPEGHLDDQGTTFIGTHQTYQQYLQAKESAARAKAQAEAEELGFKAMPEDLQQVIREGEAYIKTIREANDAIPDEVISDKLYRMEEIVRKIFMYVRENPDQVGQLRKFMSYYMPITEKLVKAYQQMDEETILGQNRTRAKEEIAETMDTINEAYEKLYDSMYVEKAMDVSSDISVLKTMFAQEGLTKDELKGGK